MTATATKSSRKGSSKPASKKAAKSGKAKTKAVVATTEVNPKEVFGSYKSGDYSAFCKKNHIRLNQTGITLPADESGEAFGKAVNKSNAAFAEASTRWEANEQYGRQHYNKHGFMHRDGLTRLNDEALALLMAQAGEELAQRAAFSGGAVENKKINPATALNHINGLSAWLKGRPAEIKGSRKAAAYELVKSDTGGKVLELTA